MRILERIEGPQDLKTLSEKELSQLATEMRQEMITIVSRTGGHLASSLGAVELTLALHLAFTSPQDKIIWDVGHQSYGHKLLTGRRELFQSLRQYGGLSGFPKRSESPHDPFGTGHASTSISAALGLALARDLKGERHAVVAVIGDGALTGGMALEALNHAGQLGRNLIVVLNDNELSISKNVGAMSAYLTRLRTDPMYSKGKEEMEALLLKLPSIGHRVVRLAERLKDSLKYMVVPGMLFEELGFTYLGPLDGHNVLQLREVLQKARVVGGPVLVHVLTRKGKGYAPAEDRPGLFHGVGTFDLQNGEVIKGDGPPTYTQVFGSTLAKLAEKREEIVAITAAMPSGTGLEEFARRFPRRFFDVGIAEQHAVTLAAGLAASGLRPVVAIYSTFLQRAYDQVVHDVCLQKLPVLFALDRSGIVGEDGETHQGIFDLSYLRHIPNLTIMAPKDERDLQEMLATGLSLPGPVALRYPRDRGVGMELVAEPRPLAVGRAEVLREGSDLAILALGPMAHEALKAAQRLGERGIKAAVLNPRFVKPLDRGLILNYAKKCGRLLTVEEQVLAGGFGSAVLELLAAERLADLEVVCLGLEDCFVEHGQRQLLLNKFGLSSEGIFKAALERFALPLPSSGTGG